MGNLIYPHNHLLMSRDATLIVELIQEAKFWTLSPTVQLQFRDTDQGTLTFKEGGCISMADLLVLTG